MRIATLMSGTLVAQVIMLGFMPLLTRLYTPEEFGVYSLFFSVVSILGLVSSLKYDQAIMLPKSDKNAQALVFLSIFITLIVVCIASLVVFQFEPIILIYFSGLAGILWMIPIGALLIGLLQIMSAYSSRRQFYKKIATVRAINAVSVVSIQGLSRSSIKIHGFVYEINGMVINLSEFILYFNGLIAGKLVADFISILLLAKYHLKNKTLQFKVISYKRLRYVLKRYDQFPKYQSFTVFINAISQNMPILLLGIYYSADIAGFFALTVRALKAPISLIGASTKEVFYQTASQKYAQGEEVLLLYFKTTCGLAKLFIAPFLFVLFFGEQLFSIVFGKEWVVAGEISQVLIIWIFFLFINSPSITMFNVLHLQRVSMLVEIVSVAFRFIAIYAGYYFFNSYFLSVVFFVGSSVAINSYVIMYIYFRLKKLYKREACQ